VQAPWRRRFASNAVLVLKFFDRKPANHTRDRYLACRHPDAEVLRRQSDQRVDELTAAGDHDGADTWRRITAAVAQLGNNTPR
jgi:hypothetical protein